MGRRKESRARAPARARARPTATMSNHTTLGETTMLREDRDTGLMKRRRRKSGRGAKRGKSSAVISMESNILLQL